VAQPLRPDTAPRATLLRPPPDTLIVAAKRLLFVGFDLHRSRARCGLAGRGSAGRTAAASPPPGRSCCLPLVGFGACGRVLLLLAGALEVDGTRHAIIRMPPSAVVVVDPGGDRVTCLRARVEALAVASTPVQIHSPTQGASCTPRSRAICVTSLPVSRTIRTAPSRNSQSKFRRTIGTNSLKATSLGYEGKPKSRQTVEIANSKVDEFEVPDAYVLEAHYVSFFAGLRRSPGCWRGRRDLYTCTALRDRRSRPPSGGCRRRWPPTPSCRSHGPSC
jgi:hypothetical protein